MIDSLAFDCPYCGTLNETSLDCSQGSRQEWVTDCEICCRPIIVTFSLENGEIVELFVRKENE